MGPSELDSELYDDLEPIVRGMGFELVELKSIKTKSNTRVTIVIYRKEGLDLDACANVLKTLRPRIQIITGSTDAYVEVSSPGTERILKSVREYGIFRGRGVRVLVNGESDWTGGVLAKVGDSTIELTTKDGVRALSFGQIKKMKLDDVQEVG